MKRLAVGILTMIICIVTAGCSTSTSISKTWTAKDFSFYDENGKEIAFPIQNKDISLADLNTGKASDFKTEQGVQVGDRAVTALDKYNIDGFYYCVTNSWGNGSATEEKGKLQNKDFHSKYKTFSEALKHANELDSTGLVLYASMQFYLDGNKLAPCELNEAGNPKNPDYKKDSYCVYFIVEDEKIKNINFETQKAIQ